MYDVSKKPVRSCDEPLDGVKSVLEFNGTPEQYVSWRQDAKAAYKLLVLRNKVRGQTNLTLSSFNTIIDRLRTSVPYI